MWILQHQLTTACFFQCRIGDFSDPVVALWNRETFQLLSSVGTSGPIHDASFSPSAANQLACVGSRGVYFCFVHTCGSDVELRVNGSRTTLCLFDDRPAELRCCHSFFIWNIFKMLLAFDCVSTLCRSREWKHQQRWVMWSWRLCPTTQTRSSSLPLIEDMFASGMLIHGIVSWPGKPKRAKSVTTV